MKIKEEMGNPYRIANGMTNLGIAYSELKLYPKAVEKLTKAKNIFEELEHFTNLSTVCKNLGDIHLELSQPHRAILEFESAITYSKKNDDKRAEYLAKEGLSKALFYVSNYKKAYLLQSEFIKLRDSVLSTEKRDEIASLKAKYEYDKERAVLEANFEKDKALDQAKIKQQVLIRNTAIGGGAIGMVALIVGFILVKRKKEAEFNEILTSSKLQTIRAQLNPHFIFNTLNSINDYIQRNDKETASNFLVRFSKMIRTVLDHSKEIEVSLDEEITFLENYVKLEQQRLNDGFTFTISVDDQINTEETLIPPSLIQPFVENSIWHGLSQKENGEGELSISISKNGEMLLCAIEDNGTGITNGKVSKPNHHKSFGTISAQNRLDILNDIKGNSKTKIQFIEKDEGIRVEIKIPFHLDTDI
jgi:tetratricopeptide (TPR) repeat protein